MRETQYRQKPISWLFSISLSSGSVLSVLVVSLWVTTLQVHLTF